MIDASNWIIASLIVSYVSNGQLPANMTTQKIILLFFVTKITLISGYHLNVTAIIGQDAEIPCELTPHTKTDNAYLVLWWFKDIFGTPIYRSAYSYFPNKRAGLNERAV